MTAIDPNQSRRSPCYLAHSANDDGAGVAEQLAQHLKSVAERAAEFATVFGAAEQARAAGLLHDLGKYAQRFQEYLKQQTRRAGDHWSAGAVLLAARMGPLGLIPALAVAGHHAGLCELPRASRQEKWANDIAKRMQQQPDEFTDPNLKQLFQRYQADGFTIPRIPQGLKPACPMAADMLDVRMLFSALVDADFLETEAHFAGDAGQPRRPRPSGPRLDVEKAIASLERHLGPLRERFHNSPMAAVREQLLQRCLEAAKQPPGLFALSAPTGAGKTLAMLAFALHHAREHGLRRIVLVMPFLNIIDQTARIYREIFSPERGFDPLFVLEHHSLVEYEERPTEQRGDDYSASLPRLLSENWDAPVVLTTSVQFFESLMASRPARCRRLHRLARSVILFDEVQTLPVKLAVPALATLSRLAEAEPYGSTVLFATATQPEFEALDERVREFAGAGWQPTQIVPNPVPLYQPAAARVKVSWRHQEELPLEELAGELAEHEQALCVVNLKRHAAQLAQTLVEHGAPHVRHLSTNMCPAHRANVLQQVNERLQAGKPIALVATQCVEAGVDLDFPVVYRALAPLESIAQAAGRCNRHGSAQRGRVVVFKPEDEQGIYPPGYKQAVQATELFLAHLAQKHDLNALEIINDPARLSDYFRLLYGLTGRSSPEAELHDEQELIGALKAGNFAEVARLFRLIKQDSIEVLVPYQRDVFEQLRCELTEAERLTPELIRQWIRRARAHAVSLFRPHDFRAPVWSHLEPVQFSRRRVVEHHEASWFIAQESLEYDPLTGLVVPTDASFVL